MRFPPIRRVALIAFLAAAAFGVISTAAILADGLTDEEEKADVAVVLGNQVFPDGRPSPRLAARLDAALAVHRAGLAPVLLVSGGTGKEGRDEAMVMRDYLVARGVPDSAIVVDSEGWTTGHTARNAATWMRERGLTRAIVVTQYFHVARSRLALEQCGVRIVTGAHPRFFEWGDLYSIAREVAGWYAYRLRGCDPPDPAPDSDG